MQQRDDLTVLDVAALRARYDEAVNEINATRDDRLTTEFYAKTGDAVFTAGCAALEALQRHRAHAHAVCARWRR